MTNPIRIPGTFVCLVAAAMMLGPAWATPVQTDQAALDVDQISLPVDIDEMIEYLGTGYYQPDREMSLEDAILTALEYNHDLNSARLSAAAACQGVDVAWTALNPQLGVQAKGYWQSFNGPSGGGNPAGNDMQRSVVLGLTQRLYDFGLTQDLIDVEKAKHGIELQTVNMTEQQLVRDVIKAYYSFNLALGQARVRDDELKLARELLRQAEIQYRTGVVPQLDVIRAKSRVEDARSNYISAQATVGDSAAYFHSLLGLEDRRYVPARMTAPLTQIGPAPLELNAAIERALDQRPELALQDSLLAATSAGKKLTRNRPVIDAYGNAMFQIPTTQAGTDVYQYGIELKWNLYTGGKDRASAKKADLELKSIQEDIFNLEALIELDTTVAWNAVVAARSRTASARTTLALATEAYRAASTGYSAGVTPYTDYIDAMDKNVAAAIGYLVALSDVKLAQADLALAAGYPYGYPGDSRARGNPDATVLETLGLMEDNEVDAAGSGQEMEQTEAEQGEL